MQLWSDLYLSFQLLHIAHMVKQTSQRISIKILYLCLYFKRLCWLFLVSYHINSFYNIPDKLTTSFLMIKIISPMIKEKEIK